MRGIKIIKKDKKIEGEIKLPSSKSISNRVLLIRSLCDGKFKIENISESTDTQLLEILLEKISSPSSFSEPLLIDCRDSGTVARFLTTYVALIKKGNYIITGSERMQQRPMEDLVKSLNEMGAKVLCLEHEGFLPFKIEPPICIKDTVSIDCSVSSQFLSSLLLVAPLLPDGLNIFVKGIIASKPYIDMTISLMAFYGIKVKSENANFVIQHQKYIPENIFIEADWSAAAFWYQMAAFSESVNLKLIGLNRNSIQGDSKLVDIYKYFGIKTLFESDGAFLEKEKCNTEPFECDFINIPDIFPSVALTCAFLNTPSTLTGISNLKFKESDRILAIVNELKRMGIGTLINSGGNIISFINKTITSYPQNVILRTYQDHRIAMSFASCAVLTGNICIEDAKVINKSYPDFWEHLKKARFKIIDIN